MIEHDVIISDCGLKSNMAGRNFIRLAIRNRNDNLKLIQIFEKL